MKLLDAPTIVHKFSPAEPWFRAAQQRVRELHANPPTTNRQGVDQTGHELKQLAEDIWSVNGQLGIHTDKTRKGFRVIGLVLINEPELRLVTHDGIFPLQPGLVYHIDGRSPHGALELRYVNAPFSSQCITGPLTGGLFGFMAWDVHRGEDVDEMLASMPESMQAFANGEERIDVSTAAKPLLED